MPELLREQFLLPVDLLYLIAADAATPSDIMTTGVYEVFAYALRYWFIAVAVGMLIAMIRISYKEYKARKAVQNELRQYVGYVEIIGGPEEFIGDRFGLRDMTTIGRADYCDIVLPDPTVAGEHAYISMDRGRLVLTPVDGQTKINDRRAVRPHAIKTSDRIRLGDVEFAVSIHRTRVG